MQMYPSLICKLTYSSSCSLSGLICLCQYRTKLLEWIVDIIVDDLLSSSGSTFCPFRSKDKERSAFTQNPLGFWSAQPQMQWPATPWDMFLHGHHFEAFHVKESARLLVSYGILGKWFSPAVFIINYWRKYNASCWAPEMVGTTWIHVENILKRSRFNLHFKQQEQADSL